MRIAILYILLTALYGCASVPVTHRRQLSLVPESELVQTSNVAYQEFLNENVVVSPYNANSVLVKKVGEKLAIACRQYLTEHGDVSRISGYNWEFNLVKGDIKNAWCMPGGKVVVYEGILTETQNEAGLAVVLSHEIAHAIARHGNERVSQQILTQMGGSTIETILGGVDYKGIDLKGVVVNTYNMGSKIGLLKFSRNHETEADKMGLVFMEYAGYDSNSAIEFWKRMSSNSSSGQPVFFSTHPSDNQRIADIKAYIPVAKSYISK